MRKKQDAQDFFGSLCDEYYEKVLRYLYGVLGEESSARDCTQNVFLTALQKAPLLLQHPNPGGFLFQTAKILAKKSRRESFRQVLLEELPEDGAADPGSDIATVLDRQIDETGYIEAVLSQLTPEKRRLYALYYTGGLAMSEIAARMGLEEPALRMRYVRLRREIRELASQVAEQHFIS